MRASIVIINYNYGRFLRQAIESALAQTYNDTEVVVIDDGSTDNSSEVIRSYGDLIIPVFKKNGSWDNLMATVGVVSPARVALRCVCSRPNPA